MTSETETETIEAPVKPTRHQQRAQRLRDVHIWLEPEIYQRLKKGADKDGRSASQMARQLIIKGMKGMARV